MHVHLVNPSDTSFGMGVITPRWLYVIAAATPAAAPRSRAARPTSMPPKGIAGMYAYAHDIAWLGGIEVHSFQRFAGDDGVTACSRLGYRFIALTDDNFYPFTPDRHRTG